MAKKSSPNGTIDTPNEVEKAVHVVLGAPAAVADVVSETVERLRDSDQREKEIKSLREQVERGLEAAEKRGVEIREQLPSQVERGLKAAEKRGDEVRKQLVDQAKTARERLEPTVRRIEREARERGRQVSDTTQEQFRTVQDRVRDLV
jgi:DNA anti-recombination protein RmuC